MTSFLQKLRRNPSSNTKPTESKTKDQFRDSDDPRILYKISDRAKNITLRVNISDREILVTVPGEGSIAKAKRFVAKQADWIEVQLESLPPPQPFIPGGSVLMRGELYQLVKPEGRGRPRVNHASKVINVPSPDLESFSGRVRRFMIREAREELEAASHHYADLVDKRVGKVSIRDTSSRWGSCITRKGEGHISYSWRLICAPEFVLEYVAAHECAHLVHADHSKNFWDLCADIYPDMKKAKKWLRLNGPLLHAVGAEF